MSSKGLFGAASPEAVDGQASARLSSPAAAEVLPWIGAAGFAPGSVTSPKRQKVRAAYYSLSQSFAQYMIRELSLDAFMEVYRSADPPAELRRSTGRSLEQWKDQWQRYLKDLD